MLTKEQFSRYFAGETGLTIKDSRIVCNAVFDALGVLLYDKGESVMIDGFGSFKQKIVKAHKVRHPATGELINVPEKVVVKFTKSKAYRSPEEKDRIANEKKPMDYGSEECYDFLIGRFPEDDDYDELFDEETASEEKVNE